MPAKKATGELPLPTERLDPVTGKMIKYKTPEALATPPDLGSVSAISKIAGKNPPVANLRDHPEWNGMDCYITEVHFGEGEVNGRHSDYFVASAFICPPGGKPSKDNFVLLRTGAGNMYERVSAAFVMNALPIKGTLRKGGRAWFLD
jgi:hypothetical protein